MTRPVRRLEAKKSPPRFLAEARICPVRGDRPFPTPTLRDPVIEACEQALAL